MSEYDHLTDLPNREPDDLHARIAAAICLARVAANPDGCGGGEIGWHALGAPGRCAECQAEAHTVITGKTPSPATTARDRQGELRAVVKALPGDYTDYGGTIERWADPAAAYPDCSCGCRWAVPLGGTLGYDWLVCARPDGPRAGLLTFEHQAGKLCFTPDPATSDAAPIGAEPLGEFDPAQHT